MPIDVMNRWCAVHLPNGFSPGAASTGVITHTSSGRSVAVDQQIIQLFAGIKLVVFESLEGGGWSQGGSKAESSELRW